MPAYDKADLERRMAGSVEALKHDLGGLRTGRVGFEERVRFFLFDGIRHAAPEVLARGVPFLDDTGTFIGELRNAVEDSLDRAADQRITEIDVLESFLHDDIAAFIYQRLKRRPMVLPVVVEV